MISIEIETRDFLKSPLVFHLLVYFLIVVFYRKDIKDWIMIAFAVVCACLLMLF